MFRYQQGLGFGGLGDFDEYMLCSLRLRRGAKWALRVTEDIKDDCCCRISRNVPKKWLVQVHITEVSELMAVIRAGIASPEQAKYLAGSLAAKARTLWKDGRPVDIAASACIPFLLLAFHTRAQRLDRGSPCFEFIRGCIPCFIGPAELTPRVEMLWMGELDAEGCGVLPGESIDGLGWPEKFENDDGSGIREHRARLRKCAWTRAHTRAGVHPPRGGAEESVSGSHGDGGPQEEAEVEQLLDWIRDAPDTRPVHGTRGFNDRIIELQRLGDRGLRGAGVPTREADWTLGQGPRAAERSLGIGNRRDQVAIGPYCATTGELCRSFGNREGRSLQRLRVCRGSSESGDSDECGSCNPLSDSGESRRATVRCFGPVCVATGDVVPQWQVEPSVHLRQQDRPVHWRILSREDYYNWVHMSSTGVPGDLRRRTGEGCDTEGLAQRGRSSGTCLRSNTTGEPRGWVPVVLPVPEEGMRAPSMWEPVLLPCGPLGTTPQVLYTQVGASGAGRVAAYFCLLNEGAFVEEYRDPDTSGVGSAAVGLFYQQHTSARVDCHGILTMVNRLANLGAAENLTAEESSQQERCMYQESEENLYPNFPKIGLNAGACAPRAALVANAIDYVVTRLVTPPELFSIRELQKKAKELWHPLYKKGHSKHDEKRVSKENEEEDLIGVGGMPDVSDVINGEPICGIVGRENGTCLKDEIAAKLVGILVLPGSCKPCVYSSSRNNVQDAIRQRCTEKAKPCTFTTDDREKISKLVAKSMEKDGPFSEARIRKFYSEVFDIETFRGGKWTKNRIWTKIASLMKTVDPKYDLKVMVKLEPMQEGKPPRFLIADGDEGQIMAMLAIKCFEWCLYGHMPSKHVKHVGRREAAQDVVKDLKDLRFVEGDGSAWDTTCNNDVRALFEGPILAHITKIAATYCMLPDCWVWAHVTICADAWLKLIFKDKYGRLCIWIKGQRRSGHAGTSCLNWWVNFCMWICSMFKEPWRMLCDKTRKGQDVTGAMLAWAGKFEGDDSGVGTDRDLLSESCNALRKAILDFWDRGGFAMKFVFPLFSGDESSVRKTPLVGAIVSRRATFCGMSYAVNELGQLTGEFCPELPRALRSGAISCSPEGRDAFMRSDLYRAKQVARACALGRSVDFAGISPMLSMKYFRYSKSMGVGKILECADSREVSFKLTGKVGADLSEIESTVLALNTGKDQTDDLKLWHALGYEVSELECDVFFQYDWAWTRLTQFDDFRNSLPSAFR